MERGLLVSQRERQVNEYNDEICSQIKTKDKRQKTAPGNCPIYPSLIHSLRLLLAPPIHFPLHPVQTTIPNGISHSPYDGINSISHNGINGISHNGINGISHDGISHDIFHMPA